MPSKHITYIMCDTLKVPYPPIIKPLIFLNEREKNKGKIFPNQICIHSTGSGARHHMSNKDWFFQRFQEVADSLKNQYSIIQIGSSSDPLLENVIDLRGKTTIRQTASILYNSKFFIGQVGFLMHLARAVNCRSVIIYGGRERPDQTGYNCNINLYSNVSCSPCWYSNFCPANKICMKQITVEDVLEAVGKLTCFANALDSPSCSISHLKSNMNYE